MGGWGWGPQNQDSSSSGPILGSDPRIVGTDHSLDEPNGPIVLMLACMHAVCYRLDSKVRVSFHPCYLHSPKLTWKPKYPS